MTTVRNPSSTRCARVSRPRTLLTEGLPSAPDRFPLLWRPAVDRTARSGDLRRALPQLRSAYTFVELTIVLLIMGILAAVAAPRYVEATNRFRVDAAARRIVADLNHVRGRAMMKGPVQEEWVSFFAVTEKYQLHDDPDPDHTNQEYWVDLSQTAYPVNLVSAAFTNSLGFTSNQTVKYDMYGFARSGTATVAPLTSGQIVVAAGSEQRTITIDPVTGKASVL